MKRSFLLVGLLTATACLTACGGSKDFNMSFEEALEIANHSELQNVLAQNENFQLDFNISGNFDSEWNKISADISTSSKQSTENKNSDASLKFSANADAEWENVKLDWALDIKQLDDTIYLNLSSLNIEWSEDMGMVSMMVESFKNQWFYIPLSGLGDVPSTFSILKDSEDLNNKVKDVVINEWAVVYNWKFTQFNGYNARRFSLDNEKLNALIKEYYEDVFKSLDEEEYPEVPELNIQNFEWYLVITWKDKVTSVIDNMDVIDWETTINANWYAGDDYVLNLESEWEDAINVVANKKWSNYEVSIKASDELSLEWTISPKISKSSILIKFDMKVVVKAEEEWESDVVIPLKGSWAYEAISAFEVVAPTDAEDLSEILESYLGSILWWGDYDYDDYEDYDYEDYDFEAIEGLDEAAEQEVVEEVVAEEVEAAEEVTEAVEAE